MVRATVAEVKKLFGGTLPANWTTEANVTNLCAQVDAVINGKTYPNTLSTTDPNVVQLCNELVVRYMMHGNWAHAGGILSGQPEPQIWTKDLEDRLVRLSTDSTSKGFKTPRSLQRLTVFT